MRMVHGHQFCGGGKLVPVHWPQEALGKAAGVGKSYISQIENTGKTASTKVLKALAEALDVGMDDLA